MEDNKVTMYEENLKLHETKVKMDLARQYVMDMVMHEHYPKMDRTLCLLLDLNYDGLRAVKEVE